MEHVSAFPIYQRIQLDKLIGLKRGVPSRAGPGAVAPLTTLKRRPWTSHTTLRQATAKPPPPAVRRPLTAGTGPGSRRRIAGVR